MSYSQTARGGIEMPWAKMRPLNSPASPKQLQDVWKLIGLYSENAYLSAPFVPVAMRIS